MAKVLGKKPLRAKRSVETYKDCNCEAYCYCGGSIPSAPVDEGMYEQRSTPQYEV